VPPSDHTIEGIARVVGHDAGGMWLEPEQTSSCGSCASAAMCGDKGIGSIAGRLERRRFRIDDIAALEVGARVVVGVDDRLLVKGALAAYALPLATAFAAGGYCQWRLGDDLWTMAATVAGLAAGLLGARIAARRLGRGGRLQPRFLRRAEAGESCQPTGAAR
jgi:sigma-E factor negative regulatory protein RseC